MDLSIDQVIAVSSSVAAAVSAIATLCTVLQIAANKKSSYKPEVIFASTKFTTREVKDDPNDRGRDKQISVDVYNIGLGPAKNMKISWSFSISSALAKIDALADSGVNVKTFKYKNDFLFSNAEGGSSSAWRNQKTIIIDFVLPASVDKQSLVVRIPYVYSVLWESYVIAAVSDDKADLIDNFPELAFKVSYQDVAGIKYTISRKLKFDIVSISPGEGVAGSVSNSKE
ncbi:hypothetical protein [Pseudomonas sp. HS6]|uniref:hypothetical protein n=1 Tax=Pseudomonas sp. HS6 TaxID=2850559 RepID=UPI0020190382|nr:hypothetical protein [Pseudomonas sp. HS6]UQS17213.1 hypothetical protein JJN09_10265 [Pseudomonas sp. HS6]